MSKQTALEYFYQRIYAIDITSVFLQAKEMEKEQRAEDWQLGYDACEFHNDYNELQKEPIKNPYNK